MNKQKKSVKSSVTRTMASFLVAAMAVLQMPFAAFRPIVAHAEGNTVREVTEKYTWTTNKNLFDEGAGNSSYSFWFGGAEFYRMNASTQAGKSNTHSLSSTQINNDNWYMLGFSSWGDKSFKTAFGTGPTDNTAEGDYYYQKVLTYGEVLYQEYIKDLLHGEEQNMIVAAPADYIDDMVVTTGSDESFMDTLRKSGYVSDELYRYDVAATSRDLVQGGAATGLTNRITDYNRTKSGSSQLLISIDNAASIAARAGEEAITDVTLNVRANNAYILKGPHIYAPSIYDAQANPGLGGMADGASNMITRTFAGKVPGTANDLLACYTWSGSKKAINEVLNFRPMFELDADKAFMMRCVHLYPDYADYGVSDTLASYELDKAHSYLGYKFVIPNGNLSGIRFNVTDNDIEHLKAGDTVEIRYTGAKTSPVDNQFAGETADSHLYISAAIINDNGVIMYYKALQEVTAATGTVKLTIPASATFDENVKVCIFEEQRNDAIKHGNSVAYQLSDYVSDIFVLKNAPITSVYNDYSAKEYTATDYGILWHFQLDADGNAINVYMDGSGENKSINASQLMCGSSGPRQGSFSSSGASGSAVDGGYYYIFPEYIAGHKIISIGGGTEDTPVIPFNLASGKQWYLPDSIKKINDCAFYYKSSLQAGGQKCAMAALYAGTIESIGTKAFFNTSVRRIRIENLTGEIGYRAFANGEYTLNVWITGGTDDACVSEYAFENCTGLETIILDGTLLVKDNAFKKSSNAAKTSLGHSVRFESQSQTAGLNGDYISEIEDKTLRIKYTGKPVVVSDDIPFTINKADFKIWYVDGATETDITDNANCHLLYYGTTSPGFDLRTEIGGEKENFPVQITVDDLSGKMRNGIWFVAAYYTDDTSGIYRSTIVTVESDDAYYNEQLTDEYGTYAGIRKGINDLNDEIDAKAAEITTLTERITELEAAGNNDAEVTELRNQLSTARSDLNALQSRYDTLDAALTAYKTAHQETGIGYMGKDADGNDVVFLDGVPYQYNPDSVQDYELGGHTFKMYTGTGDPLGTGDTTFRFYVTEGSEAVHVLSGDGSEAVYTQTLWDMIYEADKELADAQDGLTTLQNGLDEVIDVLKNAGIDVDLADDATDAETVAKVKESVQELVTDYTAVKDDYAAIKEEIFNGTADGKTRQETIDALHDLYEKTSDVVKQLEEAIGTTSEGDDKEALKKLLDQIQKMKEGVGSDLSVIEEINKSLNITDANEAVSTIQSLYRQIATLQAQVNDLSKENGNLKNQVASLQSASTPGSHTEYITKNDPKILDQNAALSADNQTLLKAYNELVEAYNFLMAKSNGQQDQITSLESDNSDLRNQVATLEKRPTSGSSIAQTGNSQTIVVEEEKEDQGVVELIEPSEPTEPETETETETEPEEYTMAGKEMSYLAGLLEMDGMTDQELYEYLQNGMAEEGYEDEEEYLIHLLMDKYGITAKAASDMLNGWVSPADPEPETETIETETETETASAEVVIEEDDGGVDTTKLAMMIAGGAAVVGGAGAGTVLLLKKGRVRGRKPGKASGNENAEEDALDVDTDDEDEEDSSDDEEDEDEDDDDEEYEDDDSDDEESDDEEE